MPTDPGADRRRIGFRDDLRCVGGRVTPSISINGDRGVKTQHGPARHANPIAGNDTEHQRAGRLARTVDDDPFPGLADELEQAQVG